MDPVQNPYSPNAGAPPPALIGRDGLLSAFAIALKRVQLGRSQKSLLPTGLRGVGKTVLLNRFVDEAKALGYVVAQVKAAESDTFIETLAGEVRRTLYEVSAKAKVKTAVSRALGVLKSFTLTFGMTDLSVRLGVDPQVGNGDSGVLKLRPNRALCGGRRSGS